MTRTLVAGPPCAGKTTYVARYASADVTVVDQDVLGFRRMNGMLRLAREGRIEGELWIIRCLPGRSEREARAAEWGCTDIVLLRPDRATLVRRAQERPNPETMIKAIDQWIAVEGTEEHAPALTW